MRTPKWKLDGVSPIDKIPLASGWRIPKWTKEKIYRNLRSIDNERPTNEEIEFLLSQPCIKCKEMFDGNKRSVFVRTEHDLLWWHGLKIGQIPLLHCKYKI